LNTFASAGVENLTKEAKKRRRHGGPPLGAMGDELHLFPVGHPEAIQMSEKSPAVPYAQQPRLVVNMARRAMHQLDAEQHV
jgi:hypothetical protein